MRWGQMKGIWEKCRATTTDLVGGAAGDATSLFLTVGTTVPESVYRHVYGIVLQNTAATYNWVHVYHVPDNAQGTQYILKNAHLERGGDSPYGGKSYRAYPENPDPLKPIYPVEGGGKLWALAATASARVTILYWDDVLTGIESD